jgi:predicted nucleic acid-binding Zn ribbon protein
MNARSVRSRETASTVSSPTAAWVVARTRPGSRSRRRTARGRHSADAQPQRGGYSGPRPDDTDPQPIGNVLAGYVGDRGWERPLAEARVFADWYSLVGADVAAHCSPTQLRDGELRIAAESTAWATQLRLLAATLLARLAAELGPDVVGKVVVSGPVGPSWRHGPRAVPGARGPRDTYG